MICPSVHQFVTSVAHICLIPKVAACCRDAYGPSVAVTPAKNGRVSKNPPAVIMVLFSQHMTTTHGPKDFPEDSAQRLCSLFPESHVWLIAFFFLVTLVKAASA